MLGRCTSAVGQDGVWTVRGRSRGGIDGNVSDASFFADMQGHGVPGVELPVAVAVGETGGAVGNKLQHLFRPLFHQRVVVRTNAFYNLEADGLALLLTEDSHDGDVLEVSGLQRVGFRTLVSHDEPALVYRHDFAVVEEHVPIPHLAIYERVDVVLAVLALVAVKILDGAPSYFPLPANLAIASYTELSP